MIGLKNLFLASLLIALQWPSRAIAENASFFEALVKVIQSNKIESIDDLLPHLDTAFKSNYSLAFESRSPIGASASSPRVILSSDESKVVLSFASDKTMQGGNKLEIIEFNDVEGRSEFKQIEFPKFSGQSTHFDSDPFTCKACHGSSQADAQDLHYIWDTYPDWPGFYGIGHRGESGFSRGASALPYFEREKTDFEKVKREASKSRLKYLIGLDEKTLANMAEQNTKFSQNIQKLNMDRIVRLIKKNPNLERYSAALLSLDDVVLFKRYLPDEDKPAYDDAITDLNERYNSQLREYFEDKLARIKEPYLNAEGNSLQAVDKLKLENLKYTGAKRPLFFKRTASYLGSLSSLSDKTLIHSNFEFILSRLGVPSEIVGMTKLSKYYTLQSPVAAVKDFYPEFLERYVYIRHPELREFDRLLKEYEGYSGLNGFQKNRRENIVKALYDKTTPPDKDVCGTTIRRLLKNIF